MKLNVLTSLLRCGLALTCLALLAGPSHAADAQDFSPAERLVFMTPHLAALRPPTTLKYAFRKSGSLEEGFADTMSVALSARPDGTCCAAHGEVLSGARRLNLPDLESAESNPVVMYFLERDVREMNRLTKGSQAYFRKRVRMALYEGATVRDVVLNYRGREVKAQEVLITPYRDDPNRQRFEQYAHKEYRFLLSSAVPGGVVGIRTLLPSATAGAPPLMAEDLFIEGAQAPAAKTSP